jgi:ribosomal protein L31E
MQHFATKCTVKLAVPNLRLNFRIFNRRKRAFRAVRLLEEKVTTHVPQAAEKLLLESDKC